MTIPPAALEAGVKAFAAAEANDYTTRDEDLCTAFRAMIEAWPGMRHDGPSGGGISQEPLQLSRIILPLTEASDE